MSRCCRAYSFSLEGGPPRILSASVIAAFTPSPLTGEGGGEGGADPYHISRRLCRLPLRLGVPPITLSRQGRGNRIVLAAQQPFLPLIP